jgi:hypothetical protein
VAWEDYRYNNFDIYFAKSSDRGGTWTDPNLRVNDDLRTNEKNQQKPSLAVDLFGAVYVVWEDYRSGNWDIYFSSLQPEHPISPKATYLKVEGYYESTPEIQHLITHEPTFSFTHYDMNSDPLIQYNASVWDAEGSSLLWYCNMTMTEPVPSGTEVSLKYNTLPYPTNGPPLEDGETYKLRVSVQNSTGTWSYFSEAEFHLNEVFSPIALVSPLDDTVIAASSIQVVNWTSPEPDSEGDSPVIYYWQVATDSTFTNVIASGSGINTSSDAFSTTPSTSYYWRVNLYDGWETGSYGNATYGYWNFTTSTPSTDNSPPTITNKASVPNSIVVNSTLAFTFIATDGDLDSLVWSKVSGPNWLTIGSTNGTIYGTPSLNDLGTNDFTIQVSDGISGIDSHAFTINVQTEQERNGGDADDSSMTLVLALIFIIIVVILIVVIVKLRKKSGKGENIY